MPRFDGTGPQGAGPLTGWGEGYCADDQPTNMAQSGRPGIGWWPMRRRAYYPRWRRSLPFGRGRGGRGPGRGRRGSW